MLCGAGPCTTLPGRASTNWRQVRGAAAVDAAGGVECRLNNHRMRFCNGKTKSVRPTSVTSTW